MATPLISTTTTLTVISITMSTIWVAVIYFLVTVSTMISYSMITSSISLCTMPTIAMITSSIGLCAMAAIAVTTCSISLRAMCFCSMITRSIYLCTMIIRAKTMISVITAFYTWHIANRGINSGPINWINYITYINSLINPPSGFS